MGRTHITQVSSESDPIGYPKSKIAGKTAIKIVLQLKIIMKIFKKFNFDLAKERLSFCRFKI